MVVESMGLTQSFSVRTRSLFLSAAATTPKFLTLKNHWFLEIGKRISCCHECGMQVVMLLEKMAPGGWICKTDPEGKEWELVSSGYRNEYDNCIQS